MASLLMPLLGSVAGKAGDALVAELLRAWGLDDHRRRLERHLSAVQPILLDAEARSRTSAGAGVREWIKDLKTAAYKAGDVLDDFRYEALRRRAHIRGSTTRKVLSYFTVNSPIIFRPSMSRKLKDVLKKIDELVVEMNKFRFLEHTETPGIVHPQTHSHVDESGIVGKQFEKEEVVNILLNKSDDNNVMVLPIVGMGGIGKTTLAQLVYNDQRARRHFDLHIWVCVSDKFVLTDLVRSVIEVAKMQRCDLPGNLEVLQKELGHVLGKKKFLLVLDDVWNEDEQKWDDLRSLLWSNAGSGSSIVVTSRRDRVASIMGTIDPYKISPLNEDPSWVLFCRKAFRGGGGVEEEPELISIAKKIVKKCNGLPLAINTMAGLLSSKHPSEWYSFLVSDVWTSDSNEAKNTLKLSYDHLSSEAKRCFSFCAVFPKDSLMEKDMLIQLWIANDFIASEDRGQIIFNELVWRCFLQDVVELQTYLPNGFYDFLYRATSCKMHDLMHDLAESISGNDCSILQESSSQNIPQGSAHASSLLNDIRHLSVDSVDTSAVMKEIIAPRTILFLKEQRQGISFSMSKSKFTSLRAFKTYNFDSVMRHMTHLKHLRYLDLSTSDIVALPEATAMLYSLQTLNLIGCKFLRELPESMRYMSSLRHVLLSRCGSLKRMPTGIGQLNCLQTLTDYVIDSEAGRGIDQLKDLSLGGSLRLSGLEKVQSGENAKQCNIYSKHKLNKLSFRWDYGFNREEVISVHLSEGILEALRPPNRLDALEVAGYSGAKFSSWMQNSTLLEHLSELYLSRCNNCKDLPPLWQLPSLSYLSLWGMFSLTSICSIGNDTCNGESCCSPPTFLKLETMFVNFMPKLERWHQEVAGQVAAVSFPQLKKLKIYNCPVLASMPKLPLLEDLQVHNAKRVPLHHLIDLSVQSNLGCEGHILVGSIGLQPLNRYSSRLGDSYMSLEFQDLTENVELIQEDLNKIPCRFIKGLVIRYHNYLFSSEPSQILVQNMGNHFAFVEHLVIQGCSDIVQWPGVESFRNLNCLRMLELTSCPNLTGAFPSTSGDQQGILLPQLERLQIEGCENLVQIPKLPASLEMLEVGDCPRLVSLPANLGNLTKLRDLTVYSCDILTRFPDGMDGLTSLKKLWIVGCQGVQTLPEGLLQQLPTLEDLWIEGCPDLERACSCGGAYWDLVQAIPHARIGRRDIHQKETAQDNDNFTGRCAKSLARVQSMCLPCA